MILKRYALSTENLQVNEISSFEEASFWISEIVKIFHAKGLLLPSNISHCTLWNDILETYERICSPYIFNVNLTKAVKQMNSECVEQVKGKELLDSNLEIHDSRDPILKSSLPEKADTEYHARYLVFRSVSNVLTTLLKCGLSLGTTIHYSYLEEDQHPFKIMYLQLMKFAGRIGYEAFKHTLVTFLQFNTNCAQVHLQPEAFKSNYRSYLSTLTPGPLLHYLSRVDELMHCHGWDDEQVYRIFSILEEATSLKEAERCHICSPVDT